MYTGQWNYDSGSISSRRGNSDIQVVLKNCALLTNCISEINNTQKDNVKDIDVVMPM